MTSGAIGAPPNSNLAESSASVLDREGSAAVSENPSSRPAAATNCYKQIQAAEKELEYKTLQIEFIIEL